MKPSWIFIILVPFFVSLLNLQNAHAVTLRFLEWEFTTSAAFAIQLPALLGGLIGLGIGLRSRRRPPADHFVEPPDSGPPFGSDRLTRSL